MQFSDLVVAARRPMLAVTLVAASLALVACASKKSSDDAAAAQAPAAAPVASESAATADSVDAGATPSAPVQADSAGAGAVRGKLRETVYFAYDSAVLTREGMATLREHAAKLKKGSGEIRVEGHADERGTPEYNLALGQRRADVARSFFISQGIAAGRIEAVSYGESKPVAGGHDEAAWAKNRRVEIRYGR